MIFMNKNHNSLNKIYSFYKILISCCLIISISAMNQEKESQVKRAADSSSEQVLSFANGISVRKPIKQLQDALPVPELQHLIMSYIGWEQQDLKTHGEVGKQVSFSPCGTHLASISSGRLLTTWKLINKKFEDPASNKTNTTAFCSLTFGRDVAVGGYGFVAILTRSVDAVKMIEETFQNAACGAISAIAFSQDNSYLICGSHFGRMMIVLLKNDGYAMPYREYVHQNEIHSISFSLNKDWFFTASRDGQVKIWKIINNEPKLLQTIENGAFNQGSIVFASGGTAIVLVDQAGNIKKYSLINDQFILDKEITEAHAFKFSMITAAQAGNYLATSGVDDDRNTIRIWQLENNQLKFNRKLISSCDINSMSLSSDGNYLAIGKCDGGVTVWNNQVLEIEQDQDETVKAIK